MIVEKRTYTVRQGGVPQYMKLYEEFGLKAQTSILGQPVGWYYPEIGDLNQIIHMWGYKSLAERTRLRAKLDKDKDWAVFRTKLRESGLVVRQESQILIPAPWSPQPKTAKSK